MLFGGHFIKRIYRKGGGYSKKSDQHTIQRAFEEFKSAISTKRGGNMIQMFKVMNGLVRINNILFTPNRLSQPLAGNILYYIIYYITLHYITLHYITLHYITLYYIIYYIILYYIVLYHISYYIIYYIILYIILCYVMLCYVILYYIILYYIILYYIILY